MKKKKKKLLLAMAEQYRGSGAGPSCRHFGLCGGCMFQDIPYEGQLLLKREMLNGIMEGVASVERVNPSRPFRYRSRMDIVTAFGKTGLREGGSYRRVVDVEGCSIMQERSDLLLQKLRPLVREIEDYDYLAHRGYLRYVVFREALFTGEVMVNFVTASRENRLEPLLAALEDHADSVSILFNDGLADLSFGPVTEDVKRGWIEEDFDGLRYRITPNSFFQSNAEVALAMYRRIREEAGGRVLDLYSGVGSISLFAASRAEKVTGVESVPEAVESARLNASLNGITKAEFVCVDAREYLSGFSGECDTLILDPPRGGMHPKILPVIEKLAAPKIIYMSCNPAAFRSELQHLPGYRIASFEAWDMFPQTPHIETLAVLRRI